MYITQNDIAKMRIRAGAALGIGAIIKDLLEKDKASEEYKQAEIGARYYRGEHDILKHDFRKDTVVTTDADGKEITETFINPNRSNHLEVHPFFHNHVEQKVAYISGREPSILVDGAKRGEDGSAANDEQKYQDALAKTTGEAFNDILADWETMASWGGVAWLHEYLDAQGQLKQAVIPRTEGLPIYDTEYQRTLVEFIRHYPIRVNEAGAEKTITRVEWWTAQDVTYYISDDIEGFKLDPDVATNPAPHYWDVTRTTAEDGETQVETGRKPRSWGRLPFVELPNNRDRTTDLQRYKSLIDANDLISSKGTNNLLDFNEFWTVIQGFGGDFASAMAKRLKINQAVAITSQGGDVEMKQLALDMKGRIDWMKELRDAIHEFGMAVDINPDRIGNAPSGVSLKFQYTLLDLKANRMIAKLKTALKEHFAFVTEMLNRKGTNWDAGKVSVRINKSLITNDVETVNMLSQSQGLVPEKLLLAAHPLVDDADQTYKDLLEERKARDKAQKALFGQPPGKDEDE
jgi:SPP1 family phage portal protein